MQLKNISQNFHFILLAQNAPSHSPLPILERPNIRIHAVSFGPMITADSNQTFVLCITDAFAKYTLVTEIAYKKAETVDDTMYKEWFSKFSIPTQIHMDGGKEFNV
jgi:hypothetical protein